MYAHYHPGTSALTSDDTDGICSAYPAGGVRETSSGALTGDTCDATPRHGFSAACASADAGSAAPANSNAGAGVVLLASSARAGNSAAHDVKVCVRIEEKSWAYTLPTPRAAAQRPAVWYAPGRYPAERSAGHCAIPSGGLH